MAYGWLCCYPATATQSIGNGDFIFARRCVA